jgi:protein-S-isoprenylcysteine O-methyltransferase Ste14
MHRETDAAPAQPQAPQLLSALAEAPACAAPAAGLELKRCVCSYVATMVIIAAGFFFYTRLSPYYIALYRLSWHPMLAGHVAPVKIDIEMALRFFALAYALLLIPYYALRRGRYSNAWTLFAWLGVQCRRKLRGQRAMPATEAERQAMLCLLLKFIFIPFCIHGLMAYLAYTNDQLIDFAAILKHGWNQDLFALYNAHLHMFILNLIFLADFFPFVVGYLIQARFLDNEVVSVDPSLAGWVACLLCYPPFNAAMASLLPWQVVELAPLHPTFSRTAHLIANGALLIFFACYASASVSLGFKCCNLMHRGIVSRGLYRRIRHPAYLFKNLAWWIGALPLVVSAAQSSARELFWVLFCMSGWSSIYLLRALREERHLSRHADYQAYMRQVRWRFIPGLF